MNPITLTLSLITSLLLGQVAHTLTKKEAVAVAGYTNQVADTVIAKRIAELEVLEAFKNQLPSAYAEAKAAYPEWEVRVRQRQADLNGFADSLPEDE